MDKTKVILRILLLAFFVLSMLGPWTFDLLNVPAQFECQKPSVRLYGDFCGFPLSGFGVLSWAADGLASTFEVWAEGDVGVSIPELLVLLIYPWIILTPFLSLLLLIWKIDSRRLQTIHLVLCGLAGASALILFIFQTKREQFIHFMFLLWGLDLYILLAVSAMLVEILAFRSRDR